MMMMMMPRGNETSHNRYNEEVVFPFGAGEHHL